MTDDATWILNRAAKSPRRRGAADVASMREHRTERDIAFENLLYKSLGKIEHLLRVYVEPGVVRRLAAVDVTTNQRLKSAVRGS